MKEENKEKIIKILKTIKSKILIIKDKTVELILEMKAKILKKREQMKIQQEFKLSQEPEFKHNQEVKNPNPKNRTSDFFWSF